jgi:hypothetical protein
MELLSTQDADGRQRQRGAIVTLQTVRGMVSLAATDHGSPVRPRCTLAAQSNGRPPPQTRGTLRFEVPSSTRLRLLQIALWMEIAVPIEPSSRFRFAGSIQRKDL